VTPLASPGKSDDMTASELELRPTERQVPGAALHAARRPRWRSRNCAATNGPARPSATGKDARATQVVERVRQARDRGLEVLLRERNPDGSWARPLDLYAFSGALYVIMLRTTGLIERAGAAEEEGRLVRHMVCQVRPDGGFCKFPGSPSSKTITRAVVLSLRLSLGQVAPGPRHPSWFRRNETIDGELEREMRTMLEAAEHFLDAGKGATRLSFEIDHMPLAALLAAYVEWERSFRPVPLLEPRLWARVARSPRLAAAERRLNRMTRTSMPGIAILYRRIRQRRRRSHRADEEAVRQLAEQLENEQNENGGWFFSAIHTMLFVMALAAAGVSTDRPTIARAHEYLRGMTFDAGDGGTFVNAVNGDLWDTSHAAYTYFRAPGSTAEDDAIRPSVELLLRWQSRDGGHAWGSGSPNNTDKDCTGFALRSLALAARTAKGSMATRIEAALRRGLEYLLSRQNGGGGFNIWDESPVRGRRGPCGVVYQKLFDMPTADVTGRVLEALAELGLTVEHEPIRRALRFLLRTQCRNGAWWSRWWAGYLAGTGYVLRAYGALGLAYGEELGVTDRLLERCHRAMTAGVNFVVEHQNADGGWGETIRSDTDRRFAGAGDSTPLQTAHVLSALLSCGWPAGSTVVRRGIRYLLGTEAPEGGWEDDQATFTIFAGGLYYPYPFMARVMPVDALTDYLEAVGDGIGAGAPTCATPSRPGR
jgi:squalene-hopene/tetraprenyl-beta-curcumene cyclase